MDVQKMKTGFSRTKSLWFSSVAVRVCLCVRRCVRVSVVLTITHLVTLNILSSRRALNTLIPNDAPGLIISQITSKILPTITWRGDQWVKLLVCFNKRF